MVLDTSTKSNILPLLVRPLHKFKIFEGQEQIPFATGRPLACMAVHVVCVCIMSAGGQGFMAVSKQT